MALCVFLRSLTSLSVLSISCGSTSYLSWETLWKCHLNSSLVMLWPSIAFLSIPPSSLRILCISPMLPILLASSHRSIFSFHHSRSSCLNLLFMFLLASFSLSFTISRWFCHLAFPARVLILSAVLFLSFTCVFICTFSLSSSSSWPIVHGFATCLFFLPHTSNNDWVSISDMLFQICSFFAPLSFRLSQLFLNLLLVFLLYFSILQSLVSYLWWSLFWYLSYPSYFTPYLQLHWSMHGRTSPSPPLPAFSVHTGASVHSSWGSHPVHTIAYGPCCTMYPSSCGRKRSLHRTTTAPDTTPVGDVPPRLWVCGGRISP